MILREILKCKLKLTVHGKEPDITVPKGWNMGVLEYKDGDVVVELWTSTISQPQANKEDLDTIKEPFSVLVSHAKSPSEIGLVRNTQKEVVDSG